MGSNGVDQLFDFDVIMIVLTKLHAFQFISDELMHDTWFWLWTLEGCEFIMEF